MSTLLIKNGRVIDPSSGLDAVMDLYLSDGKVSSIGPRKDDTNNSNTADLTVIDAEGLYLLPGLIDIHTHLRDPGYEYKETIQTGTKAAAAGGFTSIACMANTDPVNDNESVTSYISNTAKKDGAVNVFPIGAATKGLKGQTLAEIGELVRAGCIAISDDGLSITDGGLMRRVLEYSMLFNVPVISHCEDLNIAEGGYMNEGVIATRLGIKGTPKAAEESMVARDIMLAELTGGRLHIAHISTAGSVELVRRAKERGTAVTAEVTPHHITLTDKAVLDYNTNAKMSPPLRNRADIDALINALNDGTIDCIATDHAPHSSIEKDIEFDNAANGVVGLETAFALVWGLVDKGLIDHTCAVERMTIGAARVMGLKKGKIGVGMDADITIVDPNKEWVVNPESFMSKGRNTPFGGHILKGKIVKTIVKGKVVYDGSR